MSLEVASGGLVTPEPDLEGTELVERARSLRPALRERQDDCEALGRLPDVTKEALVAAGLYRVLQPRRFGGYEHGIETFHQVSVELARGCPSSGWVYALTAGHPHTLASWPEEAQREVYGENGEVRIPLSGLPAGRLSPARGGYRLSGAWDYSSGCDLATHFIGVATVVGGDPATTRFALVDRKSFTILDNWDVLGMRGTGSRRVIVDDLFVPTYRTITSPSLAGAPFERPGLALLANPIYAGPIGSMLLSEVVAVAVGIGWAALDEYEEILLSRRTSYPPIVLRGESHGFQEHFGKAQALVDTAEAALTQTAADYTLWCEREATEGVAFTDEMNRRLILREQTAVTLCWNAVELLFRTGGTSATRTGSKLERYYRDLSEVRTHVTLQHERSAESYTRVRFGMQPISLY